MCWLGLSFQKDQSFNNKGSGSNGPNDHVHYVGAQGWGGDNGLNNVGDGTKEFLFISAFTYLSNFDEERLNSYFGSCDLQFQGKIHVGSHVRRDGPRCSAKMYAGPPSPPLLWAGPFRKSRL